MPRYLGVSQTLCPCPLRKRPLFAALGAIAFLSLTAATVVPLNDKFFEIMKAIEVYTNVYKEVNTYYVDEIEPNKLMRTGIEAMVGSLDPYTNYISETDVETARLRQSGQYQGIGAEIEYIDGLPTILTLYQDQPADARRPQNRRPADGDRRPRNRRL